MLFGLQPILTGLKADRFPSRAEGPTARSTGLQPCVRRCRKTRPERSPARFDPTFAADLTGRGFVGLFLGLKAQALCCRAFSPSDRAVFYSHRLCPATFACKGQGLPHRRARHSSESDDGSQWSRADLSLDGTLSVVRCSSLTIAPVTQGHRWRESVTSPAQRALRGPSPCPASRTPQKKIWRSLQQEVATGRIATASEKSSLRAHQGMDCHA